MPGDPEECRRQARHCLELAKQTASPLANAQFESLAQTWIRLAGEIARTKVLLEHWGASDQQSEAG